MKKIQLTAIFFLLSFVTESQIATFQGITNVDSCNFETQCNLVKLDTSIQNIWQIGKPAKPFFDTAYSKSFAIVTDTINPYPISNHSYFDLILDNQFYCNTIVGFKHKFQTDSLLDGGYIEISTDKGLTWVNVLYANSVIFNSWMYTENLYSETDTINGGFKGFTGTSNDWIYTQIEWVNCLPVKSNPSDTFLIMRFNFISDSVQTNKDGWMIDNILLSWVNLGSSIKENIGIYPEIQITPNPIENTSTFTFENYKNESVKILIFNSLCQKIRQIDNIKTNHFVFERNDLPNGLYFVQLKNNEKLISVAKVILK